MSNKQYTTRVMSPAAIAVNLGPVAKYGTNGFDRNSNVVIKTATIFKIRKALREFDTDNKLKVFLAMAVGDDANFLFEDEVSE